MAANGDHPLLPRHKQTTPTPVASGPALRTGNRIRMEDRQAVRRNGAPCEDDTGFHRVRTGRKARQPETDSGRQAVQLGDRQGPPPQARKDAGHLNLLPSSFMLPIMQ